MYCTISCGAFLSLIIPNIDLYLPCSCGEGAFINLSKNFSTLFPSSKAAIYKTVLNKLPSEIDSKFSFLKISLK